VHIPVRGELLRERLGQAHAGRGQLHGVRGSLAVAHRARRVRRRCWVSWLVSTVMALGETHHPSGFTDIGPRRPANVYSRPAGYAPYRAGRGACIAEFGLYNSAGMPPGLCFCCSHPHPKS